MNFEYKVGYLWKSLDEDPGQRKLKLRKCTKTARTEWGIRPSGLLIFGLPTVLGQPSSLEIFKMLFGRALAVFPTGQPLCIFIFTFSFLFLLSLSTTNSLKLLEWEASCHGVIQEGSKPRTEDVITGEVSRVAGTAAYKFRNSVSEDSAQS